jgi:adenylate cyclase
LAPAERQRQLLAYIRRIVQASSVREPTLLFVDDAHWIDEGSDALIAEVAHVVPGTRTTLLLNFRPEYSAEWMSRPSYQQLPLHPLGTEAIDALLADLLGSDSSLAQLPALMRERTGGNPFFIEEIVHSMVDSGSLVGERGAYRLDAAIERLEIPPTVHGILAARIDRLPEREKSLLQTAAAIGLRFSDPLLRRVCELGAEDVDAAVSALHAAEFIHEEALYPEVEYAFRHPLTHEVAERSQLAAHRSRVHVAIARALEDLHSDKLDEQAALLAHHWDLGGEVQPAALWHRRAAEWIAGSNSPEARRHWVRVRELAERMGDTKLARELGQQSRLMNLEYGWRLGMSADEANELVRDGEQWARSHDDPHALAALYNAFAIPCAFSLGEFSRARELCATGLGLAEEAGDTALACALELRLYFVSTGTGVVPDMFEAMEAVLRRSDADMNRASPLVGYDVPAAVAGWRGYPYLLSGQVELALEHIRRGVDLARAHESLETTGWLLQMESAALFHSGDSTRAGVRARESLEIAERIASPLSQALALHAVGQSLLIEGDGETAIPILERALSLTERVLVYESPEVLSNIALAHCSLGALGEARATAERALAMAEQRDVLRGQALALRALAFVRVERGGDAAFAEASRLLDRAEAKAEEIGHRMILPYLFELRARMADRTGDASAAEAAKNRAIELFREMGAPLQVERMTKGD